MSPHKVIRYDVVPEVVKYAGPYPYVDGLIFSVTSKITQVPTTHYTRFTGKSNYGVFELNQGRAQTRHRIFCLSFANGDVPGWDYVPIGIHPRGLYRASRIGMGTRTRRVGLVIVAIFFIGGVQLIGIGAVGEYVGRIFVTQNVRPLFTAKEICHGRAGEHQDLGRGDQDTTVVHLASLGVDEE